ncbi:hypothetical protein KJ940_17575, partial [Myxococcota bacterium]|nr:hypothetical protein [Myxococcota bacterium]
LRAAEKAAAEAAEQAKAEAQAKAAARAAERAASALVEAAEITAPTESMSSDAAPDAPSADKPKADKPKADKPSAGLKLGARVCLERGLLAGKEGEISALNGAYIKVRVGPLEVNVKAEDLRLL